MLEFIKDCFKEVKVRCNGEEVTGFKKVLVFVACVVAVGAILGISIVIVLGGIALSLCLLPVVLVFEGIRQIIEAVHDIHELKKKGNDIKNAYSEQLQQIEKNYNQNCESINNTMVSLEESKSIIQDEKGSEEDVQELEPITLEDIDAYIEFIDQYDSDEAQILDDYLKDLKEMKSKLDKTVELKKREKLEIEYDNIMFIVQERLTRHAEKMNYINNNSNRDQKKRRLYQ